MNYLIGISLVRDESVKFMKQNLINKLVDHLIPVHELQEIIWKSTILNYKWKLTYTTQIEYHF